MLGGIVLKSKVYCLIVNYPGKRLYKKVTIRQSLINPDSRKNVSRIVIFPGRLFPGPAKSLYGIMTIRETFVCESDYPGNVCKPSKV